jgi:hypothetical protein
MRHGIPHFNLEKALWDGVHLVKLLRISRDAFRRSRASDAALIYARKFFSSRSWQLTEL